MKKLRFASKATTIAACLLLGPGAANAIPIGASFDSGRWSTRCGDSEPACNALENGQLRSIGFRFEDWGSPLSVILNLSHEGETWNYQVTFSSLSAGHGVNLVAPVRFAHCFARSSCRSGIQSTVARGVPEPSTLALLLSMLLLFVAARALRRSGFPAQQAILNRI